MTNLLFLCAVNSLPKLFVEGSHDEDEQVRRLWTDRSRVYYGAVGGLCGYNGGTLSNCYAMGPVTGELYVGGLCGENEGTISDSHATGTVSSSGDCVGGLCGSNWGGHHRIVSCYAVGDVTGRSQVGGLCGKSGGTTAQMKNLSTFTAAYWDFQTLWAICEGTNYPKLQWQIPAADFLCPDGVDFRDFAHLANWWMAGDCGDRQDCDEADLNQDGLVDIQDLLIFTQHWLQGI